MIKLPKIERRVARALAALSGGALLGQVLALVSAPVLSRLYTPGHYGTQAAFLSICGPLSMLVGLQLQSAIIVVPSEEDVDSLVFGVGITALLGSASLLGLGLVGGQQFSDFLHVGANEARLLGVVGGLVVLTNALGGCASALLNRQKKYEILAGSRLTSTIIGTAISLVIGFTHPGWGGLIAGYLGASVSQLLICVGASRDRFVRALVHGSVRRSARAIFAHRKFPLFVLPSDILNSLLNQAPVYALSIYANATETGTYGMGQRMLGLPMSLLSTSIGEVFTRSAAEQYTKNGECRDLFVTVLKSLVLVALPLFFLIALLGPEVFAWFLGAKWRLSGDYVRILAPLMAVKFVTSPLSYTYVIGGHQREDLVTHACFAAVTGLAVLIAGSLTSSGTNIIAALAAVSCVFYLAVLVRSFHFSAAPGLPEGEHKMSIE